MHRMFLPSQKPSTVKSRTVLASLIAPAAVLVASALAPAAYGAAVLLPGDTIRGGQADVGNTTFTIGSQGFGNNQWPGGEPPSSAIDGLNAKYLNFGRLRTGILVNPAFNGFNGSVVTQMELWVANDSENRDPASYAIYGTNNALNFNDPSFSIASFTQIATGGLALPAARNNNNNATPVTPGVLSQTVTFANTQSYKSYLIVFPTVKDNPGGTANSMQISEVQLYGTAFFTNLNWTGSASNIWNFSATNWNSGSPSAYADGNGVTFGDAPAINTDINVATTVAPAAVAFENSNLNYSFTGAAVNGTGGLTKNGTGTVTLNNAHTYAAGIVVNQGTLSVGATGSIGSSALQVNNTNTGPGTAVNVNFATPTSIGSLSGTLATPSGGVNSANIQIAGDLTVNQTGTATYAGTIGGTGGLTKNGNLTLTLTGLNTYAGETIINAGTLASSAPALSPQGAGALPAGQPVTVNNGGTLLLGTNNGLGRFAGSVSILSVSGGTVTASPGTSSTLPAVTMTGGSIGSAGLGVSNVNYVLDGDVSTVAWLSQATISAPGIQLRKDPGNTGTGSPVNFNVARGSAAVDLSITSIVQDTGHGFTKTGDGILSLGSANTYTGLTSVTNGKVIVNDGAGFGTGPVNISGNGVVAFHSTGTVTGFQDFTLNGGATLDGAKTNVTLTTGATDQTRSIFSNSVASIAQGFVATFNYTTFGGADGATFTIQNNSPTALGTGGGGLGYGTMPKSAAYEINIYAPAGGGIGTAFATNGATGTYASVAPVNLTLGTPVTVTLTYDPVAHTLTENLVEGANQFNRVYTGVDYASVLGGTSGYIGFTGATGGVASTQNVSNFTFTTAPSFTVPNAITIATGATAGIEVQRATNGLGGTVTLAGALTLQPGASLSVSSGAASATDLPYTLQVTGATALQGAATIDVANDGTGAGKVVLAAVGGGAGAGLTKAGNGRLELNGAANYPGPTIVSAGTLAVNGTLSGSFTTVNGGATLTGAGTLGALTVANGGIVSPGNGVGSIQTGPVQFQDGSIVTLEFQSSAADQISATGAGALAGLVNLSISLLADPTDGGVFTIFNGTAPLTGYSGGARFAHLGNALDQGEAFTVNDGSITQAFVIDYVADGGNDVTLTAVVPEPASAVLLVSAATLLGLRRRRRA